MKMSTRSNSHSVTRAASFTTAMLLGSVAAGAPAARVDDADQRAFAAASPEAAAWVAAGEAAACAGRAKEAWALYARAWDAAPKSVVPARAVCRLALSLSSSESSGPSGSQQSAARAACRTALVRGGTPEDMRNNVAATVSGPELPTMIDLQAASFMADGAVHVASGQPWGYLARADLARWLGDRELLDVSLSDLRATTKTAATTDAETQRLAVLSSTHASPWVWLGRFLVGAAWLVTAAHAFARRVKRRRLGVVFGGAALLVTSLVATHAVAAGAEDSAPPGRDVAGAPADPLALGDLLMTLTSSAAAATKAGDPAAAARDWEAVTRAAPDRAYGFARLCDALEALGQREQALAACRTALLTQGTTAADYTHLVRLLLNHEGSLSVAEHRQIAVALAALDAEPQAALIAARVRCDVAAREHDRVALEDCTAKLTAAAPADWRTSSFSWVLAYERGDASSAKSLYERARAAGAPSDVLTRMEQGTRALQERRTVRALRWGLTAAASMLVLVLLSLLGARGARWLEGRRRRAVVSAPGGARRLARGRAEA
jgi:tetratricopeptide (TPR) repeat protein